jgi:hypothetical protein
MTDIPAFPHTIEHLHEPKTTGMTLRDYFAAKAMQGLLANLQLPADPSGEKLALVVYAIADHMLKARDAAQ